MKDGEKGRIKTFQYLIPIYYEPFYDKKNVSLKKIYVVISCRFR